MSGEIIQMSNKMNLIFEPADLEQASPATVSRCGMVYLEPHIMGWRPSAESYLMYTLPQKLKQDQKMLVRDLFDWLVSLSKSVMYFWLVNFNIKWPIDCFFFF